MGKTSRYKGPLHLLRISNLEKDSLHEAEVNVRARGKENYFLTVAHFISSAGPYNVIRHLPQFTRAQVWTLRRPTAYTAVCLARNGGATAAELLAETPKLGQIFAEGIAFGTSIGAS